jgi:hypothetical protein
MAAAARALRSVALEFMRSRDELVLQHKVIESSPTLLAQEHELNRRWEDALALALTPKRASAAAARRARVQAGAIMGAVWAVLRDWYASGGTLDLVRLGEEALDLISRRVSEKP